MRRISGRTHALLAALTMLGFAIGAAPALAVRSDVPSGLTSTLTAAHFQLHYNAATATATYVQQGAADFEEAWSRLVTGGGGSPNAALRGPVNDGDGKVDVYLAAPSTQPTFTGGMVSADSTAPYGAYIFMTPDLARSGFRFRAAHEFMHVLQDAYQGALPFRVGGVLTESTANWAAEWALPDLDPADSNFFDAATAPAPWLPLDCSYGTWPSPGGAARPCGNGYWQWLFIERQVETYGVDFVHGVLERVRTCNPDCSTFPVSDRAYLDAEIKAQSANSQSIGSRFDAYALDVWAPSAWTTTALQTIHSLVGRPAASIWNRSNLGPGYSGGSYVIDHLGTRYLLIRNFDDTAPSGPSDQLQFTTTRPAAAIPAWQYMTRDKGGQVWVRHAGGATVTQPADPSKVREVLIPLSNDSSSDALTFGYALRMTRGTSTPPVNDARIGAVTVALDQTATTDSVYAGGRGDLEAPGCAPIDAGVGNGVWYRFTTPNDGMYTYDTTTADFGTVVALYNGSTFAGCAAFGKFAAAQTRGTVYDVFVGRRAGETGDGTLARLKVTGPPAPPANDLRENARSVALDELAGTDNAGATGSGAQEAPGCSFASSATRGIWYRFSTLADGTYTYDTRDSDFGSVVSLYDAATGTFKGCGGDGRFAGQQHRSETYLVYVGRTSGSGTNARLRVSGPSAPTPTPTPTPSPHPTASPVPTAAPAVTPSPTPPAAIWATARATSRSLTMDRRGTVALKVSCAGDPAEHYSIAVTVSAELKGHRRTLMSGHLKLAGGATSTRKLRVSSANRRLVSRRHRLKVRITVALTARPGVIRITRTTLTLTAKR